MIVYRAGNCVRLLCCGAEYFPALEEAIDSASRDVYLETYIYADDASGRRIAAALIRAAARGVRVRIAVDGFGSRGFAGNLLNEIAAQGVEVAIYRPEDRLFRFNRARLRRLHRKIAVIDGKVAFVGGINVIDDLNGIAEPAPRFDYAVRVEGPLLEDVCADASRLWFALIWARIRHRRLKPPPLVPDARPCGDLLAAFVYRDNFRSRRDIEHGYLTAIGNATSEVLIANAYFFPGKQFRRALTDAVRRGVRVRLLLQGRVEYLLAHYAQRALYGMLLDAGIEISEYFRSFLHAKVAVVDRTWATVGSSNIDPFSLLLSREANVFVRDHGFAESLHASLERAATDSGRIVENARWRARSLVDRALTTLFYGIARRLLGLAGYADN
jgi:cardiolipin synthase